MSAISFLRLLLCGLISFAELGAGAGEPVMVHDSNSEMNAAIILAKKSINEFLRVKENPPKGAGRFGVKVRFAANGQVEHIWIVPFRKSDVADFEGLLTSDAKFIHGLQRGKQVRFSKNEISDWAYSVDGKSFGSFTECVLTRGGTPEAKRTRLELGLQCKD